MLLTLVMFLATAAGAQAAQRVSIATSSPGSIYHSGATALAKVINDKAGMAATIQPFASQNVFMPVVENGELQFGLGDAYEVALAYEGQSYYKGRDYKDLRVVGICYPMRTSLFVRKDSPFHSVADLKGHPVPAGYKSQQIILHLLAAEYATAGLTAKDFKPVNVPTVVAGANEFEAGRADTFFFALGSAKVAEANASVGGIRALDIPDTPANLAAIGKHFPTAYLSLVKPGPDNPGVTEPVHVITFDAVLFSSSKTPDDVVYKVTKAMYENKPELSSIFAVYKLFDPKEMAKKLPVPFHPGAIKFYKEKGMWPPK